MTKMILTSLSWRLQNVHKTSLNSNLSFCMVFATLWHVYLPFCAVVAIFCGTSTSHCVWYLLHVGTSNVHTFCMVFATCSYFKRSCGFREGVILGIFRVSSLGSHLGYLRVSFGISLGFHFGFLLGFI
jgi:hypothetical protein